jgi:ribose transport system ATP-binding protein
MPTADITPSRTAAPAEGSVGAEELRGGPAISIAGISKTFGLKTVLFPFDLTLAKGEIHALLGQNGSGKSTLIKILGGVYVPDAGAGDVVVDGSVLEMGSTKSAASLGMRFVHQDLGLIGGLSVLDNIAIGSGFPTKMGTIQRRRARKVAVDALAAVGLDIAPETPVAELTAAQRTGVAVARAIQTRGGRVSLLVLDEPTATLPSREVAQLHSIVRAAASRGVAILYVTHHLEEVFTLADRVSVLRDGHLVLTEPVARTSQDALVHALVGSAVEPVRREHTDLGDAPVVLSVRGLTGDALGGVGFDLHRGEIVGVHGLTGSGRESLLPTIYGARDRSAGSVRAEDQELRPGRPDLSIAAGVAYLAADRKRGGGLMELTAAENLTLPDIAPYWRRMWFRLKAELADAQGWLDRLQVRPHDGAKLPLGSFSGGNQQKILIGKWVRLAPQVLLLDEPTQGVDVGATVELHRSILEVSRSGTAVLISSTDTEELALLSDRVLIIRAGVIVEELDRADITVSELDRRVLAAAAPARSES